MKDYTARQIAIINASIAIIGEGGIQEFTIKNLSNRIGFVEAAVYRHFPSKSDILLAVLSHIEGKVLEKYSEISLLDTSPFNKLKLTIEAYFKNFATNPALVTVVLNDGIYKNDPNLQKRILSIMDSTKLHYAKILQDALNQNEIRTDIPISELSLVIMGYMRISVTRWSLQNFTGNVDTIIKNQYSTLIAILKQ